MTMTPISRPTNSGPCVGKVPADGGAFFFAAKKKAAPSAGAFPTHGPLFIGLLIGVIFILYLLQYFPALALGPIVEHFTMDAGKVF